MHQRQQSSSLEEHLVIAIQARIPFTICSRETENEKKKPREYCIREAHRSSALDRSSICPSYVRHLVDSAGKVHVDNRCR